jgi:serine/threonine protein kinase
MSYRPDAMSMRSGPPTDGPRLLGGRYELIEKIAEGGNALVYRAWDRETSEWRAIKMLMPEFAKRSTLVQRFEREGDTMKRLLDHPNICRVFDTGTEGDRVWLAMEYAEGGSVINWVERYGPMPPQMATRVAVALCKGIAYAHGEGVIHRDVKPHNLLVDRDGQCKVTDFGIAQILERTRVTMTGTVMGTIGYIAPEQHESAKHADQRADVYSIAATIYTLVHGEAATHLFMAEDRDFDGIPDPLALIIRKGAQYRREARYRSVAEMQQAFEETLDLLAPDPPSTPPLVEPGLGLPAPSRGAPSPAPVDEVSLEPMPDLRPPVYDRTPSSIIPRYSLTGGARPRRPKVRNRDEIERQYKVRAATLLVGALVVLVGFVLVVVSIFGRVTLDGYRADADHHATLLAEELQLDMRLLDLPHLEGSAELEQLFAEADANWDDKSADERIGDATRILDNIQARVSEIDAGGRRDAVRSLYEELRQADKRLTDDITLYRSRSEAFEEYRDSLLGWMGSSLPIP